jgi:kynurenine formamidase
MRCYTVFTQSTEIAGVGIDAHGVDPGHDPSGCYEPSGVSTVWYCARKSYQFRPITNQETKLAIAVLRLRGGSGSLIGVLAFVP